MGRKKSANEKLMGSGKRELVDMPSNWAKRFPPGKLLIPLPTDIRDAILKIPMGEVRTISEIREELAQQFGAVASCPLVCGIAWRLVAEAAEEDRLNAEASIAPYWRVVKDGGHLNEKLPGGIEGHAKLLESEGYRLDASSRSKKPRLLVRTR